jgi:SAM-dependent methyltransferase
MKTKKIKYEYVVNSDNPHLGGNFSEGDPATFCPAAWQYIIQKFNIKSALDVGSGRGYAAKFINELGVETIAIEGLIENVNNAIYPTIKHDLTFKPYLHKVDFVNCIEVVEHIEEKFINNLMDTLCNGSYVLMTHAVPGQKGWHHVNCQESSYWINLFKKRNFILLEEDSSTIRKLAMKDGGLHIARNGMFFKNERNS